MKALLGIIGSIIFIVFGFYMINTNLRLLIHPSQFVICVFPAIMVSWTFTPPGTFIMTLKDLFSNSKTYDESQIKNIRKCLSIFGMVALNTGIIATLLHLSISLSIKFCSVYGLFYYLATSLVGTCLGLFLYGISKAFEKKFE